MLTTRRASRLLATTTILTGLALGAGCETGGQTGALVGAGIGTVAGGLIGGDATGALIGAGIGTGVGYIVGNEADKAEARELSESTKHRNYDHDQTGALGGTRWKVVSINPRDAAGEWSSIILEFKENGHLVTTITRPNGDIDIDDEIYRVVGQTLIINDPGYIINARYRIEGRRMYADVDSEKRGDFSLVLERI